MEYPLFELQISEDEDSALEVNYTALVGEPAIEKNFLAFNEQKQNFAIVDNERRIISGPAMLPDYAMFRKADGDLPDHKVYFKKETIYEVAQKFFAKGFNQNFNLMHNPELKVEGVSVFESFITDSERGIMPMKGFEDVPEGSWFMSAKVDNDEVWGKIKSGEVKGFSVEGFFKYKKPKMTEEAAFEKIKSILNEINE
jgi:hypothetical protein